MPSDEDALCEKCDEPATVKCSCGNWFCEEDFVSSHLKKQPTHRKGGSSKSEKSWTWITGKLASLSDAASKLYFEQDEETKWFGLYVERLGDDRVTRLVETRRFSVLAQESMHHSRNSPKRQFPSLTSFVGETGAGKSTLSRSTTST
jgi:hypothetical protein